MAESLIIPPWLTREYNDPATTFLNAFKTGAAISQAQQEMAQRAHQNEVSTALQREKIQQDALQFQAQLAAKQAYEQMTNKMAQAQLEETKKQHIATGILAAARLAETRSRDQALDEYRQRQTAVDEAKLKQPSVHNVGGVLTKYDPTTGEVIPLTEKPQKELTATTDPLTSGLKVSGPLSAMQAYQKSQEAAAKAEAEQKAKSQPAASPGIMDRIGAWWRGGATSNQISKPSQSSVQRFTDKSGKVWVYTGNEPDPMKDKNPDNWQQE